MIYKTTTVITMLHTILHYEPSKGRCKERHARCAIRNICMEKSAGSISTFVRSVQRKMCPRVHRRRKHQSLVGWMLAHQKAKLLAAHRRRARLQRPAWMRC